MSFLKILCLKRKRFVTIVVVNLNQIIKYRKIWYKTVCFIKYNIKFYPVEHLK